MPTGDLPGSEDLWIRVTAAGERVNDAVLRRIAEAAAEVGITDAAALARAAVESGIVA